MQICSSVSPLALTNAEACRQASPDSASVINSLQQHAAFAKTILLWLLATLSLLRDSM